MIKLLPIFDIRNKVTAIAPHFTDTAYLSDDFIIVMKKIRITIYDVSCINSVIFIFIYVLNVYLFDVIKLKA